MKILTEEFEHYINSIYVGGLEENSQQYIEVRRAFMGGASIALYLVDELKESAQKEIDDFVFKVKSGQA